MWPLSHRPTMQLLLVVVVATLLPATVRCEVVIVRADGVTRPYTAFNSAFGSTAYEVPDCGHGQFGEPPYPGDHITLQHDSDLERPVFAFYMHLEQDSDRCLNYDRQRNEIKTHERSPPYVQAFYAETVSYSWDFKLPAGFQVTPEFTHLHQMKFVGGQDNMPLFTLTAETNASGHGVMRFAHWPINEIEARINVVELPLTPFLDTWLHVYERVTMGLFDAPVFINVTRLADGVPLLTYSGLHDNWRFDTSFCRPKWGIYRSLLFEEQLRDETVLFDRFCVAKGPFDDC